MRALAIDYVDKKTKHQIHIPISSFKKPENGKDYARLEKILDEVIDEVRDQEKHPLAVVMQIIGENLEAYEEEHYPEMGSDLDEVTFVKYLMKTRGLHQKDLAEIFGGQSNVSKYLKGERSLSKAQMLGLKKLLKISADFFVR
jgi:HTH-type transcriptional regulator/antitoxin HigA